MSGVAFGSRLVKAASRDTYSMLEVANLRKAEVEGKENTDRKKKKGKPYGAAEIAINKNK